MFHTSLPRGRRLAAGTVAAVLLVGAPLVLAAPANAAAAPGTSVSFATTCTPPAAYGYPVQHGTTAAEITVSDTTPTVGEVVTVTYDVTSPASANPSTLTLPADSALPTGTVVMSGAQTGSIAVTGPRSNTPVAPGVPFPAFKMTGTFTATSTGVINFAPGNYNVNTNYVISVDTPCAVDTPPAGNSNSVTVAPATVPNNRTITDNPASGPAGTNVGITGSGFTAGAAVTVAGFAGTSGTGDATVTTADANGNISTTLKVNAAATTGIIAFEGTTFDPTKASTVAPFSVTAVVKPGDQQQTLNSSVTAGTLSMTEAGTAVTMTAVDFAPGGNSTGTLNAVAVKDYRGGATGWSLTASNTNFTGPGGSSIPASALSWTPACTTTAGSPSTCAAGSAGPVGSGGATLAKTADAALTGGDFAATAGLTLAVPAFTAPGAYSSVLTLTLA